MIPRSFLSLPLPIFPLFQGTILLYRFFAFLQLISDPSFCLSPRLPISPLTRFSALSRPLLASPLSSPQITSKDVKPRSLGRRPPHQPEPVRAFLSNFSAEFRTRRRPSTLALTPAPLTFSPLLSLVFGSYVSVCRNFICVQSLGPIFLALGERTKENPRSCRDSGTNDTLRPSASLSSPKLHSPIYRPPPSVQR